MRQQRSYTVGLVVTDIRNPYFADLAMAVDAAIGAAGYQLLVGYSHNAVDRQRDLLEAFAQRRVDGVLVLPAVGEEKTLGAESLTSAGVPLVQVTRHLTDEFDYVGPDNVTAGRLLAGHLGSLGVSSVVFVGGPAASSSRAERLAGLADGLTGSGVHFDPRRSSIGPNIPEGGISAVAAVLDRGDLPDALVAYSDAIALGVYAELRRRGIRPGRDVAVAGFDDIALSSMQSPALTTVATHAEQVAREASRLLLRRIEGGDEAPARELVEPTLRIRASTTRWRRRG